MTSWRVLQPQPRPAPGFSATSRTWRRKTTPPPEVYAEWLAETVHHIRRGDSQALIVGPNTHNFDAICRGCGGHPSGRRWISEMLSAWQTRFGGPIPIDAWGLHLYDIDWRNTPMVNAGRLQRDVVALREFLDSIPSERGKPIWITEVGVLWRFRGWAIEADQNGGRQIVPRGGYDTERVLGFMQEMLGWLATEGPALKVQRWFWFVSAPAPDPGFAAFGGAALFADAGAAAGITPFGNAYRQFVGRDIDSGRARAAGA